MAKNSFEVAGSAIFKNGQNDEELQKEYDKHSKLDQKIKEPPALRSKHMKKN